MFSSLYYSYVLPNFNEIQDVNGNGAVYVMLALENELEGMLIAMHQKRLLDDGEYFLVGVDSKPYDPSHPRLYDEGC